MDTATRHFPAGHLRASDADRDRAVAELSEHFQAGRLTSDEFDERSGRALQARTGDELTGLLADLPRAQASGPPAPQASREPSPAARGLAAPIAVVMAVGAVTAVVAVAAITGGLNGGFGGDHSFGALVPILIVLLVVRRLAFPGRRRGYSRAEYLADHPRRVRSRDIYDD